MDLPLTDPSASRLTALGVELIVDDLDRAIELFTTIFGCSVASRGPSAHVAGEAAVLDAGSIAISLMAPAKSGEGAVLAERQPRLSQIIFGSADTSLLGASYAAAVRAGLAVEGDDTTRFHVTPESVAGALGQPTAIVVAALADTTDTTAATDATDAAGLTDS